LYRVSIFRKFFWEGWADGRAEKAGRIGRAGASGDLFSQIISY